MDKPFAAYEGDEPYVFISYSHADKDFVYPELIALRDAGVNVWYDEGIEVGSEWREELAGAIVGASAFLFFLTERSAASQYCKNETNFAADHQIPIIPIYLEPASLTDGQNMTLSHFQAIRKYEVTDAVYRQKLSRAIASQLHEVRNIPVAIPSSRHRKIQRTWLLLPVFLLAIAAIAWLVYPGVFDSDKPDNVVEVYDPNAMHSLVVTPFRSLSSNEDAGFLVEALVEEVSSKLSQSEDITLVSYSGTESDPLLMARELGVAYALNGVVRSSSGEHRVTAKLVRVSDGLSIWSKSYNLAVGADLTGVSNVADNIAVITPSELTFNVKETGGWRHDERFSGIDPVAVRHYLDAEKQWRKFQLGEGGDWMLYVNLLKKSVEVDPNFYEGFRELTYVYVGRLRNSMSFEEAAPLALEAIDKAIALRPDDVELLYQRAQIYVQMDLNYQKAEAIYNQILQLQPDHGASYYSQAEIALREGRINDAAALISTSQNAIIFHNDQTSMLGYMAGLLNFIGKYQEANRVIEKAERPESGEMRGFIDSVRADILISVGDLKGASSLAEGLLLESNDPGLSAYLLARLGRIEEARKLIQSSREDLELTFFLAAAYRLIGDLDSTYHTLQAAILNRDDLVFLTLRSGRVWDPIRDQPRFKEILSQATDMEVHTAAFTALNSKSVIQ